MNLSFLLRQARYQMRILPPNGGAITKLASELTGKLSPWDSETLKASKLIFADNGFDLIGLEGDQMDMMHIKLGLTSREEDVENTGKC